MPPSPTIHRKKSRQEKEQEKVYTSAEVERLVQKRIHELELENAQLRHSDQILRENEAKYRLIADCTYDWEQWIAPDGSFIYTSPSCERITGFSAAEFAADHGMMFRIVHPDDLQLWEEHSREAHAQWRGSSHIEFRIVTKSGETRWISHYCQPVISDEGAFLGRRGSNRDITERKRTEESMMESEARLKIAEVIEAERQQLFDVLETLPIMICLLTPDYHVAFANRRFREKFGEFHGRFCYEYCYGQSEPCAFCESYRVLETGQPHRWEVTTPDGTVIDANDFPFYDVDGTPLILEMDIDITEEKRAREALRQSFQYARSLIEASLDPFVTISVDGTIMDVNEATIQATGCSREDLIGTDFSRYFTDPQKARAGYQQVFAQGYVTDYPLTIRSTDGHMREVLYNASVYCDADGNIQGVFAAARDVTGRNRAERELVRYRDHLEELVKERTEDLKEYAEQLKRSNEDLERFAYISSHDLQEPLRTMVTFTQLLERRYKGKLDPDADEYIQYLVNGGKRMQSLIQDLLEFSRVNTKGEQFRLTDAAAVVDDALALMKTKADENAATITVDPLPMVIADPIQLRQVFSNLMSNAIKFRKPDSPPAIHIAATRHDGMVEFTVTDNGIGIEPQYYDRIFVIFQRLHGMDKYEGTGIGLAIVKRIIDRHGGTTWVESEPGEGSTFHFTLPAVKSDN